MPKCRWLKFIARMLFASIWCEASPSAARVDLVTRRRSRKRLLLLWESIIINKEWKRIYSAILKQSKKFWIHFDRQQSGRSNGHLKKRDRQWWWIVPEFRFDAHQLVFLEYARFFLTMYWSIARLVTDLRVATLGKLGQVDKTCNENEGQIQRVVQILNYNINDPAWQFK